MIPKCLSSSKLDRKMRGCLIRGRTTYRESGAPYIKIKAFSLPFYLSQNDI